MATMIKCGYCNGKMTMISRPSNTYHKNDNKHYTFTDYAVCSECGARAKVPVEVIMISEPMVQADLFQVS